MTERLNIRRMQMPEREHSGETFDPKKEITPENWKQIQEGMDSRDDLVRIRWAAEVLAIDPKQRIVSTERRKELKRVVGLNKNSSGWEEVAQLTTFGRPNG